MGKSQQNSMDPRGTLVSQCSAAYEDEKVGSPLNSNSVGDEVKNLVEVSGMMGYQLKGHEQQIRSVISGVEKSRVSQ